MENLQKILARIFSAEVEAWGEDTSLCLSFPAAEEHLTESLNTLTQKAERIELNHVSGVSLPATHGAWLKMAGKAWGGGSAALVPQSGP